MPVEFSGDSEKGMALPSSVAGVLAPSATYWFGSIGDSPCLAVMMSSVSSYRPAVLECIDDVADRGVHKLDLLQQLLRWARPLRSGIRPRPHSARSRLCPMYTAWKFMPKSAGDLAGAPLCVLPAIWFSSAFTFSAS